MMGSFFFLCFSLPLSPIIQDCGVLLLVVFFFVVVSFVSLMLSMLIMPIPEFKKK